MCLAIPGKIKSINKETHHAKVGINGVEKEVNCELVEVKKGEYVIVHAGFAIQKLGKQDASEILALFDKGMKMKSKKVR